jgi:hypothetical protein
LAKIKKEIKMEKCENCKYWVAKKDLCYVSPKPQHRGYDACACRYYVRKNKEI